MGTDAVDLFRGLLAIFIIELSDQILCPFLIGSFIILWLSCKTSLYILDAGPLSDK